MAHNISNTNVSKSSRMLTSILKNWLVTHPSPLEGFVNFPIRIFVETSPFSYSLQSMGKCKRAEDMTNYQSSINDGKFPGKREGLEKTIFEACIETCLGPISIAQLEEHLLQRDILNI
jgi:hypothetical protein